MLLCGLTPRRTRIVVTKGGQQAWQLAGLNADGYDTLLPLEVDADRLMGLQDLWVSVQYYDSGTDWFGFQAWSRCLRLCQSAYAEDQH